MDVVQDWASTLLSTHSSLSPLARQTLSVLSTIRSLVNPFITQLSEKPDLATIALLLVIALISLKLLNMLWQAVMFWLRLARTLAFWGGLVALALWMYTRGPGGVATDVEHWYRVWNGEYQYWKKQEHLAKMVRGNNLGGDRMGGLW